MMQENPMTAAVVRRIDIELDGSPLEQDYQLLLKAIKAPHQYRHHHWPDSQMLLELDGRALLPDGCELYRRVRDNLVLLLNTPMDGDLETDNCLHMVLESLAEDLELAVRHLEATH